MRSVLIDDDDNEDDDDDADNDDENDDDDNDDEDVEFAVRRTVAALKELMAALICS